MSILTSPSEIANGLSAWTPQPEEPPAGVEPTEEEQLAAAKALYETAELELDAAKGTLPKKERAYRQASKGYHETMVQIAAQRRLIFPTAAR